jgi:hypothetical protein
MVTEEELEEERRWFWKIARFYAVIVPIIGVILINLWALYCLIFR